MEGYNPFTDRTETHLLYSMELTDTYIGLTLPTQYLGDRRHAYSAELSLSLVSNFVPDSVQIVVSNADSILVKDISNSFTTQLSSFEINLTEEGFVLSPAVVPASEHELRRTLTELTSLQLVINSASLTDNRNVSLFMADLWDSVSNGDTGEVSGNVEVCDCPDRYMGQFCER